MVVVAVVVVVAVGLAVALAVAVVVAVGVALGVVVGVAIAVVVQRRCAVTSTITSPVPIELWGKDHWSMFAYLEHCCVEYRGRVTPSRMREDPAASPPQGNRHRSGDYPTRLNNGDAVSPHDDWSCIDDFVSFDLVEWRGTGANPIFALTARGFVVAAALRLHKAGGGVFHGFRVEMAGVLPPVREGPARDRVPVRTLTVTSYQAQP